MPQCCAVPMCFNRIGGHRFPRDKRRLEQWLIAIRRDHFTPTINSLVCKYHFTKHDYEKPKDSVLQNPRLILKKNAVPSIFPWSDENDKSQFNRGSKQHWSDTNTETFKDNVAIRNPLEETEQAETENTMECRACLAEIEGASCSVDLFSAWNTRWPGMGLSMAEDLARIAGIEISMSDAYSKIICRICCDRLQDAVSFTHSVQNSDIVLRRRQMDTSDDRHEWPQPIQENVTNDQEMEVEIKQEVFTEDEYDMSNNYDTKGDLDALDIKIEPEEMIQPSTDHLEFEISSPVSLSQPRILTSEEEQQKALINGEPESTEIAKSMMDQHNLPDVKIIRKRKLANACLKRYRQKKREELQKQKLLLAQNKPKYDIEQIQQIKAERRRELAKERSKRYRDKKRVSSIINIEHAIHNTQTPGPSHGDPTLATSSNMNITIVMNNSVDIRNAEKHCAGPSRSTNNVVEANKRSCSKKNCEMTIIDVPPLGPTSSQTIRSSAYSSYARDSSAHAEFLRQFTQNSFGHACKICDRLWFKNDIKNINNDTMEFIKTFLPNVDGHSIAVCRTCRNSLQKKTIPALAVYNGFKYPEIPSNLRTFPLDLVSESLISPITPFMQIRRLRHVHSQSGIYGQIMNYPIEINNLVNSLPRDISDDRCTYIDINRKKIHKSGTLRGLINKRTIKKWLGYLVHTPMYSIYGITIDNTFIDNLFDYRADSDGPDEKYRNEICENISIEESLVAQQQTVMWNDNLCYNFVSGKNTVPISFDEHGEELSFPSIYLGQYRQFREGIKVTPFMIASSEMRRSDRRGVKPQHLFYMAMKIMRIRVTDSHRVAYRHNSNLTKEKIDQSNIALLRSVPNFTWYWSEKRKNVFAMIRQLGKPTVFFTISANEIEWLDLLQLLYKLNKHESITKDGVAKLHFMVKSTLINEDAVTCAIYFNKLVNVIMTILQSRKCSPFRMFRVVHYFRHVEFRQKGSPRAHILAWLDNAPNDALNEDYNKAIELIDALISVSASDASGNVKLQTHKHRFDCFKNNTSHQAQNCRLEAPFMPSKKTMILSPMKDTEEGFIHYRKRFEQIRVSLENDDIVDIDQFYSRNGIHSDEEYYNIIRAGITRPKVFLKRNVSEKWHISFNPFILNIVKSNTDFQFITDENACAAYLVEYINKTQRGVSDLQTKIIETMNEHLEFDTTEIAKKVSADILNHTEITSQEAAWYLLRVPTCKCSLSIEYIPTERPSERLRIRETIEDTCILEDNCTDVWKENLFDKYEKRPEYLESVTLAEFVSKYTKNKNGDFVERTQPRIIQYQNYDKYSDFQEYKREMVTLHYPFRSEDAEILAEMKFISIYDDNENIIFQRRKEFESNIDIDKIMRICKEICREERSSEDEDKKQDDANRYSGPQPFESIYIKEEAG